MDYREPSHINVVNCANPGICHPDSTTLPSGQYGGHQVRTLTGVPVTSMQATTRARLLPPSPPCSRPASPEVMADTAPQPFTSLYFSDPRLPVNYESEYFIPLDKRIKPPPFQWELEHKLETDCWWRDQSRAATTLDAIRELLCRRQTLEAQGDLFEFKPLLTTLKNMQLFIEHIQAGKQFCGDLTADEAGALTRQARETAALVRAERAPYKRTVRLALSLVILADIITRRQVLDAVSRDQPGLKGYIEGAHPGSAPADLARLLAALPLRDTPGGRDGRPGIEFAMLGSSIRTTLLTSLNSQHLLLYPSFHPLTVEDFCRFGHLPVHPLGLTTNYVQGADGLLMSPLEFLVHDLDHMRSLADVGNPDYLAATAAEAMFCDCNKRLHWRSLLLDQRTTRLPGLVTSPALELLLFQLMHENWPIESAGQMNSRPFPFLYCLQELTKNRREKRLGYEAIYRNITDREAATTALWAAGLWASWQAADFQPLKPEQLETCARQFIEKDAPRLERHLAFLAQHRGALRWLFIKTASFQSLHNNDWHFCSTFNTSGPQEVRLTVFSSYDEDSGLCNLDNTDLAYFLVLGDPQWRDRIKEQTGACVPEVTWCAADTPEPMEI
ncbi:MAG: hypothetical protein OXC07_03265 [Kistimonas sp.]|nr:hypothetical protein [Kistimonas sp.]